MRITLRRTLLVTTLALLALLGAAYWFRENLVRHGANRLLADVQITLTQLQGLQVSSNRAAAGAMELTLPSGLRLAVSDLEVNFRITTLSTAPVVESLTIGSARLLREPSAQGDSPADSSTLLLSDVLQLLREFPVASIVIDELALPQRQETLALDLQHSPGVLDLRVASGALQAVARFTQAEAMATALLQVTLTRSEETVGDIELTLAPMGSTFGLTGGGHLEFADLNALLGELEQAPLAVPLRAANLDWDLAGAVADDVLGTSRPETFVLGMQAGSTVTLPADLARGLSELDMVFSDRAELTVTTGTGVGISAGNVPLRVTGSWQQEAINVDTRLTLAGCQLTGSMTCNVGFDGSAGRGVYTLAGVIHVAAVDIAAGAGAFTVRTEGLALGGLPAWLPVFDIDASLVLDQDTLTFSSPLMLRSAPADAGITTEGRYDLATGAANMHVTLPRVEFIEAGAALSTWFSDWPYTFDLLTGSLAAELELNRQPAGARTSALTASLTGTLNDVGGFYGDIFFRGLAGELQATLDTAAELVIDTPLLALTVAAIDVGVPIENVGVNFQVERASQQLRIGSIYGEVLGGTVTGADITYDFTRERNDVLVQFSGLRLERMLNQVEYEGVEAVGAVSGELPITITSTGVEVAAGTLRGDAPGGSIRYLAAAMAAAGGNAGVNLMNQALGNYQFETLTSSIDYAPDGELLLTMQLQGHNPDMNNGQRINLNLNLSDNLPALLESLQAARAIEDFLEEQYQ